MSVDAKPVAARQMVYDASQELDESAAVSSGFGLTDRQVELNHLWATYRCMQYEGRAISWDGKPALTRFDSEVVARGGVVPPGFYDAGQTLPLRFRKPDAPYYLVNVVVNRFTGLLFSEKRSPQVRVEDDIQTEDWLDGFLEATRFWSKMIQARAFGGAMGSVGLSFKFIEGRPVVEIHDPRWCEPNFDGIWDGDDEVMNFEKRFMYPKEERDPKSGKPTKVWYWYRRVIDRYKDVVWKCVPAQEGEPNWENEPSQTVHHMFGFCPVVWIQNLPVQDDLDGDPDCLGAFEMAEKIDHLYSQGSRGILANSDPTLLIASDAEWDDIGKGSDNALQVEKGAEATYLELAGTGQKEAREQAKELRSRAMEVVQCVVDDGAGGPARTALEVERQNAPMLEKADIFREQYGEGVKKLLGMALRATRTVGQAQVEEGPDGKPLLIKGTVTLPKRRVSDILGKVTFEEREVGQGEMISLDWPSYFEPSHDDAEKAVRTAGSAKQLGLVDREKAVRYIAPYFGIEDVKEAAKLAQGEAEAAGREEEAAIRGILDAAE